MRNHTKAFLESTQTNPLLARDFAKNLARNIERDQDQEILGVEMPTLPIQYESQHGPRRHQAPPQQVQP